LGNKVHHSTDFFPSLLHNTSYSFRQKFTSSIPLEDKPLQVTAIVLDGVSTAKSLPNRVIPRISYDQAKITTALIDQFKSTKKVNQKTLINLAK
jgi:hypothetical protein